MQTFENAIYQFVACKNRVLFAFNSDKQRTDDIYESVNLKGAVYEPKQNSSSLQSITTSAGFTNVGSMFYKVHSLSSEQVFN